MFLSHHLVDEQTNERAAGKMIVIAMSQYIVTLYEHEHAHKLSQIHVHDGGLPNEQAEKWIVPREKSRGKTKPQTIMMYTE